MYFLKKKQAREVKSCALFAGTAISGTVSIHRTVAAASASVIDGATEAGLLLHSCEHNRITKKGEEKLPNQL